jgi:hypothetical protein
MSTLQLACCLDRRQVCEDATVCRTSACSLAVSPQTLSPLNLAALLPLPPAPRPPIIPHLGLS